MAFFNVGPKNYLKIDRMFAFISVDKDGNEGVCGFMTANGWLPMVGADMAMVEKLKPMAKKMTKETGMKIKLITFSNRQDVEDL